MGVKGLKGYLDSEANSKLHVTEPIPNGSRLHVDGNGWMFHLMKTPEGLAIPRQYGGSYIEYDSLLRKTYHGLLDLGISLTFYFDGADSHMKSTTKKERRLQRGESWMAVYNAIVSRDPEPDQKILDLPPFTKQQFLSTLESLGATMVHCEFEADQDMVLACRKANEKSKQSQSHYCFGDDT
jgi:XPG N-terminal domain